MFRFHKKVGQKQKCREWGEGLKEELTFLSAKRKAEFGNNFYYAWNKNKSLPLLFTVCEDFQGQF